MRIHPKAERVRLLVEGLRPEVRKVLSHVLDCERCREAFTGPPRGDGGLAVDKVLSWDLVAPGNRALQRAAEAWIGELVAVADMSPPVAEEPPPAADEARGEVSDPESGWAAAEALLDESRRKRLDDPRAAEALALRALRLAERLEGALYGSKLVMDLCALAWIAVSGARRAAADMRGAEEALQAAAECLERGSGDLLESAVYLEHKGSLRKDQRRFEEAEGLLRRSSSQFRAIGDMQAACRVSLNIANVYRERGELAKAIAVVEKAAQQLDPEAEPILNLSIRHNLIDCLTDAGEFERARTLLAESEGFYEGLADGLVLVRRSWIEAKIARGTGDLEKAEDGYLKVRENFIAEGLGYDAALVSLELATLYAEQGRFSEMRRLADEMLPIFRAQDIHREALAALAIFQQAARMENVTLRLARQVAEYLERARDNPTLRFQAGR